MSVVFLIIECMSECEGVEPEAPDGPVDVVERLRAAAVMRCRAVFREYALAVELLRERVCERIAKGVAQDRWELGVAGELGLALQMSPNRAAAVLARAKELHKNMPHTLARLEAGELSPEAIPIIVCGLSHLDEPMRRTADRQLCADPATLNGMGLQQVRGEVKKIAYALDARATVERDAAAEKDRRVTIRPAPDLMGRLSMLLPVAKAVAVYAALKKSADALIGVAGEVRSHAQIMADLAFERLTGRSAAAGPAITVRLTVPASVLFGGQPGTGHLDGGGVVPAEIARRLVAKAAGTGAAWVKRLYVRPESGAVVAMDSVSRRFPTGLAEMIAARDEYCRTPYCDAPIAHIDHVRRHAVGGATVVDNGQGLCAACNYAKEADGWRSAVVPDLSGRHTVETRTPSGHTYRSTAPRRAA